jgi:hypothetical protein
MISITGESSVNTNYLFRKCLAIGIVLFCLDIVLAPAISPRVMQTFAPEESVQLTTQACGINGYETTTVMLTQTQFKEFQQYLTGFRKKLNQSTTVEETTVLFNDAIATLDRYKLLPEGMTVQHAWSLLNRTYPCFYSMDVFHGSAESNVLKHDSNFFCLLTGETSNNTRFFSITELGCSILCWSLFLLKYFLQPLISNPVGINATLSLLTSLRSVFYRINTVRMSGTGILTFGRFYTSTLPPPYHYDPAGGWITTQGVLGKKSWNGSFFGDVLRIVPFDMDSQAYYTGAVGFIGLKIDRGDGGLFFVGSALYTKVQVT